MATKRLGQLQHLGDPQPFAPSREIPDPSFLDCGGLTPLWIFPSELLTPSQAPSSRSTPRHPHGHKTSWVTAELYPQPSAPSREIPDPSFLDCGGLTPLWIFPSTCSLAIQSSVKPEHSKTPSWLQNVLGNCGTLPPTLRASASPREIPDPGFLQCGGWTPLWIFPSARLTPSKAPSSRSTPGHPHFHKTSSITAELGMGNSPKTSFFPYFRVFASSRETLFSRV
jgi:hypothetical protein